MVIHALINAMVRSTTTNDGMNVERIEPLSFVCDVDAGRHLAINTDRIEKDLKRNISFNSKKKSIVK
jgi:hypothetical protein